MLQHSECQGTKSIYYEQSQSIVNCLNKCELDVASNESETAEHSVHDGGGGREEGWKYISNYVGENVMKSPRICPWNKSKNWLFYSASLLPLLLWTVCLSLGAECEWVWASICLLICKSVNQTLNALQIRSKDKSNESNHCHYPCRQRQAVPMT